MTLSCFWLGTIFLLALLASACGGAQDEGPEVMLNEGVLTCENLLEDFAAIDPATASEAELDDAMNRSEEAAGVCSAQFASIATTEGDRILFAHRSDQLRLFSLSFEAALSRRFDEFAGYCEILSDIARILLEGINSEQQAIESGLLTEADQRKVRELLELDVQTLEVVSVQAEANCPSRDE